MTNNLIQIIEYVAGECGYQVLAPKELLQDQGIYGQCNHRDKTLWYASLYEGAHELIHVLQRSEHLCWFATRDCDGYAYPSLHGGSGYCIREWQAHSVEKFMKKLQHLLWVQETYPHSNEVRFCQFEIIPPEEWFIKLLLLRNSPKLQPWLESYGFLFTE